MHASAALSASTHKNSVGKLRKSGPHQSVTWIIVSERVFRRPQTPVQRERLAPNVSDRSDVAHTSASQNKRASALPSASTRRDDLSLSLLQRSALADSADGYGLRQRQRCTDLPSNVIILRMCIQWLLYTYGLECPSARRLSEAGVSRESCHSACLNIE